MPLYEVEGKNSTKRIKVEVDAEENIHEDFDKRTTEEYIACLKFFELVDYIDSVKVKKKDMPAKFAHRREEVKNINLPSDLGEVKDKNF